eukprot:scaffold16682_cov36-Cyclotella_meneghiniana.AAC.1
MVATRRIRYSRDATATPPPAGSDGSAHQSPGSTAHGLLLDDGGDDDVFYDAVSHAMTHSAEKELKDSVAAMVASELLKESGGNVATDPADGEDLLDDLAGSAVDSQPSDCGNKSVDNNLSSEPLDNEDGGGKMGSEEQRFHGELEMNYASLRSQHDFDHVDSILHWCEWPDIPQRARIIISNECYRASIGRSVSIHQSSITEIEQIESTNNIYWLSACLHEMFQYYADIHKEKKKRNDVIDADDISSSSSEDAVQTDDAFNKTSSNDGGPTPFIQHPNQSRFYSFRFVVAKSIMEVILNHDVPPDGSCGYHAIIKAILHYIDTFPDEADSKTKSKKGVAHDQIKLLLDWIYEFEEALV